MKSKYKYSTVKCIIHDEDVALELEIRSGHGSELIVAGTKPVIIRISA